MKIGIVVQNDYPHDVEVRPRKMATSLNRVGYSAVIISWNARKREKKEDIGHAIVYRFGYFLKSGLYPWLSSPSPLNLLWTAWIVRIAREERLDGLIASNIRIALPAILAAKLLRIPIVLDLQENNPEVVKLRDKTSLLHYITRNSKIISALEWLCIRLSNHTWVVVEERLEGLLRRGVDKGKISVIRNVPDPEQVETEEELNSSQEKKVFTLVYVGTVTRLRGIELILRSMPYILERDRAVRFLIVGDGDHRSHLENLARELGIEEYVIFAGWVNARDVPDWIRKGDLGVIPHQVNQFTNTTIPNKLFDYMAAGIPVLSTDMKPVRRVIEQRRCGVIIPLSSEYRDIAATVLELKNSPELRTEMGKRGKNAVLKEYNWQIESEIFLESLRQVLRQRRKIN